MFALFLSTMLSAAKNMAVMPFEIVGNAVTESEAEGITELYISELVSTGKISIVDRANFDKILKEMNFQNSDWSNSEKTAKLGQATNAQFISRGKIIKLGEEYHISASVIDITTAEIIASTNGHFSSIDSFASNLEYNAKSIVRQVAYSKGPGGGTIFHISGNDFYEAVFLADSVTYSEALTIVSKYRGNGYADWRLPNTVEVKYIFDNLFKGKHNKIDDSYWMREGDYVLYYVPSPYSSRCEIEGSSSHSDTHRVCLVRKFTDE